MTKQVLGIYIRVSTRIQVKNGLSADDQKIRGVELANELGWGYKLYDDRGVSASKVSYKDRYLNELISDCEKKVLSGIYCTEIDRWSRDENYDEGQIIITKIKKTKVRLYTPYGEFDLQDPMQEYMIRNKAIMASFEVKNRKKSIIRGIDRGAKMGHTKGGAYLQYGYKRGDNKMLVIDSEEAKWVKWIYRQSFEGKGKGCMVIARILNEKGIPTKIMNTIKNEGRTGMIVRGEKKTVFKWRDKTILGILKNPIYKGVRIMKGKEYEAPAIIEPELWEAVQIKIQNRNQYKDTNNLYEYLLKGLIICPVCGSKIQGKKRANGKDNCYTCTSNRYGPNCGNRGINIEYLNELVCDNIKALDTIIEEALNDTGLKQKISVHSKHLKDRNIKIADLKKKQGRYLDTFENSIGSDDAIIARLSSIAVTIKSLEMQNEIETKNLTIIQHKDALLQIAKDGIKEFKRLKSFNDRAGFVTTIIKQITVRWEEEYKAYDIVITFRINQLENYLISKQFLVNRDGRNEGKAVNRVLSEKVTVENIMQVDEENKILYYESSVDFTDKHTIFNPPSIKKSTGKIVW